MNSDQINSSYYENKYGEVLLALSRAIGETIRDGDDAAFLWILDKIEILVANAEKHFTEATKGTGHA